MKERWSVMKYVAPRSSDERAVAHLMFIAFAHDTKLICMEFDRVLVHQMYRVLPITCRGLGPSDNRPRQNFVILLRGPHLYLVFLLFSILKHSLLSSFLILVVLSICACNLYEWVC